MSFPFTEQQCFFVAIFAFAIIGFQRGWRRELISLVFVMLATFLLRPGSGNTFEQFLARILGAGGVLLTGNQSSAPAASTSLPLWGILLAFALVLALGYYVGNKSFPRAATPAERFVGIVPGIITGAFVLGYLSQFFPKDATGHSFVSVAVQTPDPSNYITILFVIAIVAVIVGLIASRAKKSAPPAKK